MRVYLNHSQSTVIHFFRNDVSAVQVSHTSLLFRDITRSLIFHASPSAVALVKIFEKIVLCNKAQQPTKILHMLRNAATMIKSHNSY